VAASLSSIIADAYAARLTFAVRDGGLLLVLLYAFQLHWLRTVGALEMLVNDEGGLRVMIHV
jgi:hypothetical protein